MNGESEATERPKYDWLFAVCASRVPAATAVAHHGYEVALVGVTEPSS